MASSQVYIVYDDQQTNLKNLGLGGKWFWFACNNCFGGTAIWTGVNGTNGTVPEPGSLSYPFEGTSISFIGNPTLSILAKSFTGYQVSLDSGSFYTSSASIANPVKYQQWYESPVLSPGSHTVNVSNYLGVLDYILVTPALDTPVSGQTLMVDDTYEGVKYAGSGWQFSPNATYPDSPAFTGGSLFQNTSHATSSVGDSFSFNYYGTNASIFGSFIWDQAGTMGLTVNIDNSPSNFTQSFSSQGFTNMHQQPHFKLFDTGPLSAGNHTVTVTLSACIGQTLVFDYFLYNPAFATLGTIPTTSSVSSFATSAKSTTTGLPENNNIDAVHKSKHGGAIAGGVIGGLVLAAIIVGGFFWWWRKKRNSAGATFDAEHMTENTPRQPIFPGYTGSASSPADEYTRTGSSQGGLVSHIRSGGSQVGAQSLSDYHVEPFTATNSEPTSSGKAAMLQTPLSPEEIRRRLAELETLIAAHSDGRSIAPSESGESIRELQRQIQVLTQENARLASYTAPPAYG